MKKVGILILILAGLAFAQLTKETVIRSIEVFEDNTVKVEYSLVIKENGKVIAQKNSYYLLNQYDKDLNLIDISGEPSRVQDICNSVWK